MTSPDPHSGEHGGAMDKLKSVWRDAVGSRDDETRADGPGAQPSGTAHPADARPETSARNASGMQPADDGTGPMTQQLPQHGAPQRAPQQAGPGAVPHQQQAPARQEQPVAAGASVGHGGPARGGMQAPPAPTTDDRAPQQAPQQAPRQAVPQQQSAPPQSAPPQSAPPQSAPPQSAPPHSAPRSPDSRPAGAQGGPQEGGEAVRRSDGDSAAARTDASATDTRQEDRATDDRATDERATDERATDDRADGQRASTAETDTADETSGEPRGRHELFDKDGSSSGGSGGAAATAGTATAAGMAGAASRSDEMSGARATEPATDGPGSNGAAPAATSATGAQDVPADPEKFVPAERAKAFAARWGEVKGEFVDEPRDAVRKADALVGDVLDEIAKVFTEQRSRIEHDLDTDDTSTEDLRQALHRYRKFFERLLNI